MDVANQHMNADIDFDLPYLITATFEIAPDAYESNDKSYEAFTLEPRQPDDQWHLSSDWRSGLVRR